MVSKIAVVQKVDLQNRNQQSQSGLSKRKPQDNFKDVYAAAVRKTAKT